jgi:hypothetical protein
MLAKLFCEALENIRLLTFGGCRALHLILNAFGSFRGGESPA